MEKKICEQCNAEFEYVLNPKFPRKYCKPCSAAKKVLYEAKQNGGVPEGELPLKSDGEPNVHHCDITGYDTKLTNPKANLLSVKDINITALALSKCYYYGNKAILRQEVLDTFNTFVKLLENNE